MKAAGKVPKDESTEGKTMELAAGKTDQQQGIGKQSAGNIITAVQRLEIRPIVR